LRGRYKVKNIFTLVDVDTSLPSPHLKVNADNGNIIIINGLSIRRHAEVLKALEKSEFLPVVNSPIIDISAFWGRMLTAPYVY
jgi:hypothetical protein